MFSIQIYDAQNVTLTFRDDGVSKISTQFGITGNFDKDVNFTNQRAGFYSYDTGDEEIYINWSHADAIHIGSELDVGDIVFSVAKTPEILNSLLDCLEQWRLASAAASEAQ